MCRRAGRDLRAGEGTLATLCAGPGPRPGIHCSVLTSPPLAPTPAQFVIGGDGPKRALLDRIVAEYGLGGRVQLVGAVPHERVRQLLVRGAVFLNCSLTEAFCMALVEAAAAGAGMGAASSLWQMPHGGCFAVMAGAGTPPRLPAPLALATPPCAPVRCPPPWHTGLLVVSTRVGGVPEVLPPDMLVLAEPSPEGLIAAVEEALARVAAGGRDAWAQHAAVRAMYSWQSIAARTEAVYRAVLRDPQCDDSMAGRLARYHKCGKWFGPICCCAAGVCRCEGRAGSMWRLRPPGHQ